jgi:hypothetical protein
VSKKVHDALGAVPDEEWLLLPLGAFMTEHRRELAQLLKGTPDWDQVARTFAQAGLRDARGRAPSAETAKETWRRVASAARSRRRSGGH